jgi:hypothetical protein
MGSTIIRNLKKKKKFGLGAAIAQLGDRLVGGWLPERHRA